MKKYVDTMEREKEITCCSAVIGTEGEVWSGHFRDVLKGWMLEGCTFKWLQWKAHYKAAEKIPSFPFLAYTIYFLFCKWVHCLSTCCGFVRLLWFLLALTHFLACQLIPQCLQVCSFVLMFCWVPKHWESIVSLLFFKIKGFSFSV